MKKFKYSQAANAEVNMLAEHMQMVAGDNRLLDVMPFKIVMEGINTHSVVWISKMNSEDAVDRVVEQMSSALYDKFNRTVRRIKDKLFISPPEVLEELGEAI